MSTDLELAQRRADTRFNIGEKQENALIDSISSMVIRDRLIAPTAMQFILQFAEENGGATETAVPSNIALTYGSDTTPYKIHRHALGQLAGKVEFPLTYLNKLANGDRWKWDLLVQNLNTLFHKTKFGRDESPRFLHRIVGNELRGFLSRRFNRHLASLPLLRAFVEKVVECKGRPVEANITDLRWSLKCYLPMVFEAFPGQYICVGVTQSHSDFGAGRHVISRAIWDPIRDTRTVLEGVGKVHLGSVIEDADIELSEGTAVAEVDAQCRAAQDTVQAYLGEESVEKALTAVRLAHEEQIPWEQLRTSLSRLLNQKELETLEAFKNNSDIVDLPPIGKTASGDPLPTKWWVSSAVAKIASNQEEERKIELQALAGKWVG